MWISQRRRIAQLEAANSRYEQDINSLKEQVSNLTKNHPLVTTTAVEHLKDANQALVDIYKNRWSFFGVIFPIVTILLTATFAYNIWKADQLEQMEKGGLAILDKVENVRSLLVSQADVLGHFAEAMSMLNMGYRESSRERYSLAAKQGARAAEQLYAAKALIEAAQLKGLNIGPVPAGEQDPQSEKITESLKSTAQELLLAACELKARSYTQIYVDSCAITGVGNRSKLDHVHEIALEMLNIDKNRWEGHHWLGLFYNYIEDFDDAEKEFQLAVDEDTDIKIDAINLAEDCFLQERFPQCQNAVQVYNKFDIDASIENSIVTSFFNEVSALLMTGDLTIKDKFDSFVGEQHGYKRNYDYETILQFGKDIGKKHLINTDPARIKAVKQMITKLIDTATGTNVDLM